MSKMSSLHAETASDRAESAENEVEFLKSLMRIAATDAHKVVEVIHATANPNSIIATDLIARLNRVIDGLRKGAGEPSLMGEGAVIELEDAEF